MGEFKMKTKRKIEFISSSNLEIIAKTSRMLSYSIMSDENILKQYNKLDNALRNKIINEVKRIDTKGKTDTIENEFTLRVVDIHIIAGKYNIDPAVVLATVAFNSKCRLLVK